MEWLRKEVSGKQLFNFIFYCIATCFVCNAIAVAIMYFLKVHISPIKGDPMTIFTVYFPLLLFAYAFIEEVIFRLPLAIFIQMGFSISKLLAVAIVLSAIFGFLHGGVEHIFLQGVTGFIYSILFFKAGGLQKKYSKALLVVATGHFLFNFTIAVLIALSGEKFI